jgi:hypothetical protein
MTTAVFHVKHLAVSESSALPIPQTPFSTTDLMFHVKHNPGWIEVARRVFHVKHFFLLAQTMRLHKNLALISPRGSHILARNTQN